MKKLSNYDDYLRVYIKCCYNIQYINMKKLNFKLLILILYNEVFIYNEI